MLRAAGDLNGYRIAARDGDIGAVVDLFFDDRAWTVRYLVVDTGGWLPGRRVLISPLVVSATDWAGRRIAVRLMREQVQRSPDVDTHKPVSRQREWELARYYGYPHYWGGPYLWGPIPYPPLGTPPPPVDAGGRPAAKRRRKQAESHLRSLREVTGYTIEATDGDIGHVEDFLIDERAWAMRYLVIDTRNWWPGKKVLVAPGWIRAVSWSESKVVVGLARERIRSAPEYDPGRPLDREYEVRLHDHYGQPRYWERGDRTPAA